MKVVIVFLLVTPMVVLVTGKVQSRIVDGDLMQQADRQEFSFLVSLQYHKPNRVTNLSGFPHVCQGTLVHEEFIVTAAHCFSAMTHEGAQNLADWTAVAGEYDLSETDQFEQTRRISHIFPHPDFNITEFDLLDNRLDKPFSDIALLKVDHPFELGNYVSTITYIPGSCIQPGNTCYIYGWGAPNDNQPGQRFPHKGTLLMPGPNTCHDAYDTFNPIIAAGAVFCTQGTTQNAEGRVTDGCQADSGGPFVCECQETGGRVLTGIVSFGIACGFPGLPGIYTDLREQEIHNFVWETIGNNL